MGHKEAVVVTEYLVLVLCSTILSPHQCNQDRNAMTDLLKPKISRIGVDVRSPDHHPVKRYDDKYELEDVCFIIPLMHHL